jgi:hypothetical protein
MPANRRGAHVRNSSLAEEDQAKTQDSVLVQKVDIFQFQKKNCSIAIKHESSKPKAV